MVHTLPDGTTKYRMVKVFGQIDSGELAARLGSQSIEDRRGNIIWYDDFEAPGTKWTTVTSGTGVDASISATKSWLGTQSFKLKTGNVTDNVAAIWKKFRQPGDAKIGVEVHWNLPSGNAECLLYLYGYTGTYVYDSALKVDCKNKKLQYYDSTGTYQDIATSVYMDHTLEMWTMLKLVIDWQTKKYVRAIFGNDEYDLSAYSIKSAEDTTGEQMSLYLENKTKLNANITSYVDGFILTQNEP